MFTKTHSLGCPKAVLSTLPTGALVRTVPTSCRVDRLGYWTPAFRDYPFALLRAVSPGRAMLKQTNGRAPRTNEATASDRVRGPRRRRTSRGKRKSEVIPNPMSGHARSKLGTEQLYEFQGRTREFVPMNFHYALAGASLDSVIREIADSAI